VDFNDRTADPYLNITSLLGSNFKFKIDGFTPPNILNITLTLINPSTLTAYDVCIVFEDLYGKKVLNPDGYMDIYGPYDIDPFIAFKKDDPIRAFPPGNDSQPLNVAYNGNPNVKFFIIAHLGGNTGGVYQISNCFAFGDLTTNGGTATIYADVYDYQGDISYVVADTRIFTGALSFLQPSGSPNPWMASFSNSLGVPVGKYNILVAATSPANPTYKTYNYASVTVAEGMTSFGQDISPDGDTEFIIRELYSSGMHSMAVKGDEFYLVFSAFSPIDNHGAVFFTKSVDRGMTWSTAIPVSDLSDDQPERNACIALGNDDIYVACIGGSFDKNSLFVSSDDGDSWTGYAPFTTIGSPLNSISMCIDTVASPETVYLGITYFSVDGVVVNAGRASSSDLNTWTFGQINDTTVMFMQYDLSLSFDKNTNHILACWSSQSDNPMGGALLMFDWTNTSDYPTWHVDQPVSDNWVPGDQEIGPSPIIEPSTGNLGILYKHILSDYSKMELRLVKIDHSTNPVAISPTILVYETPQYIQYPSLACETSGRWLATWMMGPDPSQLDCYFQESLDKGDTWTNLLTVNDVPSLNSSNSTIASNGKDVCIGWVDARNANYEVWIDHGTH